MNRNKNQSHQFLSPLRYPGGKGTLSSFLKEVVVSNDLLDGHYVEAFAGGGAVAWSLLFGEYVSHVHINDLDRSIYCFWVSVLDHTDDLCQMIRDTRVNMTQWRKQKVVQNNPNDFSTLDLGFSTFFLNRTNRSGIITGGVIGGKRQTGEWKISARFNKKDLIERIQRIARYQSRITVYGLDGRDFIKTILPDLPLQTLIYLDPPYYAKGKALYQNQLTHSDHAEIASVTQRRIRQPWVVSYDSVPPITAMYKSSRKLRYRLNYRAQDRYCGEEVMIFSNSISIPETSLLGRAPA